MDLNNLPYADRKCAATLVTEILLREDRRLSITVNDGEEDTLIRSRDIGLVLECMATTDWDFLKVFEQQTDGSWMRCGYFWLIYGNGGSEPIETISDFSWKPDPVIEELMDSIYRNVELKLEGVES